MFFCWGYTIIKPITNNKNKNKLMSIKHLTRVVAIIALSLFTLSPLNAATNYQSLPDLKLGDVSIYVKEIQKVQSLQCMNQEIQLQKTLLWQRL